MSLSNPTLIAVMSNKTKKPSITDE
jgi:hypothetical protein